LSLITFLARTASEALYLHTKRDIQNANHELEKKYRKRCHEVASINREREQEALRSKMEAKDHNLAEVDRCNQLFEVKYQTIQRLNEQIRTALNAETQKRIGKSIFERAVSLHTAVLFLILGL
jgi:hypothetical protein